MKIRNNLIIFLMISIFLTFVNIKNPIKTKFFILTSKIERLTLGNLITITFLSGFASSSLLTLISSSNIYKKEENYSNLENDINNTTFNNIVNETISDRPPERDIRDSQPTISVNYRFVDSDINTSKSNNSKKNKNNTTDNDWINRESEW